MTSKHEKNVQSWWDKVRQSDEPPSPTEYMKNVFGHSDENAEGCCWKALSVLCTNQETPPGSVAYVLRRDAGIFNINRGPNYYNVYGENSYRRHLVDLVEDALNNDNGNSVNGPHEEDLLALLNLIPPRDECDFNFFLVNTGNYRRYSQKLLEKIYSRSSIDLTPACEEYFVKAFSATRPTENESFEDLYESAMEYTLPKIKHCTMTHTSITNNNISKFLKVLVTKNTKTKDLYFNCGMTSLEGRSMAHLIKKEDRIDSKLLTKEVRQWKCSGGCEIERVVLAKDHAEAKDFCCSCCMPVLQATLHMLCLNELVITEDTACPSEALPIICKLMERPSFTSLCCRWKRYESHAHYKKKKNSSAVKREVSSFFEALKSNASLTCLYISGLDKSLPKNCQEIMTDILMQNTSLCEVELSNDKLPEHDEVFEYYTLLNRCGRAKALDPQTSLADMVDILRDAIEDFDFLARKESRSWASNPCGFSNIEPIYAFLHESPAMKSFFSRFLSGQDSSKKVEKAQGRKRKRKRAVAKKGVASRKK